MKYLALIFLVALGLVELALRVIALACIIVVTLFFGVYLYVDNHPADFKDLMTPVCFKIAEWLVP